MTDNSLQPIVDLYAEVCGTIDTAKSRSFSFEERAVVHAILGLKQAGIDLNLTRYFTIYILRSLFVYSTTQNHKEGLRSDLQSIYHRLPQAMLTDYCGFFTHQVYFSQLAYAYCVWHAAQQYQQSERQYLKRMMKAITNPQERQQNLVLANMVASNSYNALAPELMANVFNGSLGELHEVIAMFRNTFQAIELVRHEAFALGQPVDFSAQFN